MADAARRFCHNRVATASVIVLAVIVIIALLAPTWTPRLYDLILNNEAMFDDTYAAFNNADFPRKPDWANQLWVRHRCQ
ncbi:MAG: hypothetical protein R3E89_16400 [Thiolinea sp.]